MVDATLGDRMTLSIDPNWDHRSLWDHPLGDRIEFTYVDWEGGISEAASPNYADTEVIGRAEGYKHWSSTSNREIQFTAKFRVQNSGRDALLREVVYPARFLDKLKYPVIDLSTELSYAPPPVILRVGQLIHARAVVTAADIQWMEPFEPDTLLPHGADVQLTVTVVRTASRDMGYRSESITSGKWI